MEFEFRRTRESDIDALFEVRANTRENPVSRARLAAMGITPSSLAEALDSGAITGWVCTHERLVIGFCSGEAVTGEVLVLAVLPEYEGRSVGKQLLAHVVGELRGQDPSRRLWLAASSDPRTRAHGFYRAQGWQPTGKSDASGDEILILGAPAA